MKAVLLKKDSLNETYPFVEGQLILMRHGQAEHNLLGIYNSNPSLSQYKPSHLTKEGEAQVLHTAERLLKQGFHPDTIHAVYVSPLPRTQETALILVKAGVISEKTIVLDKRLMEVQFWDLEGMPIIRPWMNIFSDLYHTETQEQLFRRISGFATERFGSKIDKHILVITHAYIAQLLIKFLKNEDNTRIETAQAIVMPLP